MVQDSPRWGSISVEENAPQRAPSLAEQTYQTLKRWIVEGDLEPGVALSENDLSRRFSISRSPLREAIRRLQEDGLLNASGPRGFTVPDLSVDLIRQVYGVRLALESAAAASASIPESEVKAAGAKLRELGKEVKAGKFDNFTRSDFEFHDLFVQNCGNPMLVDHVDRIRGHVRRIANFAGQLAEHSRASYAEHVIIHEAMKTGDNLALRDAVEGHIKGVTERLVLQLEARAS